MMVKYKAIPKDGYYEDGYAVVDSRNVFTGTYGKREHSKEELEFLEQVNTATWTVVPKKLLNSHVGQNFTIKIQLIQEE